MNSSFSKINDIKPDQYNKEIVRWIILNILFFIIALINKEIYSIIVSFARISILWIFICVISYKENVEYKNILTIMETTSLFLILLCALSFARINGTKIEFFSLSFIFINLSNYIFINRIEDKIIKKNYLIIIYFLFASMYIFNISLFDSNKVNYLYIVINFLISSFNLIKLERDKINNIKHYNMIKISSILTFVNVILGMLYFAFYNKNDLNVLQGTISLLFFNYTYYLYLYTIKYIVKNPYYEIIYKNEELNNKSYELKKINEIIKNEIEISNRIKQDINQRQELLDQSLDAMPNSWVITDYNFNVLYINAKFRSIFGEKIKNFYQILYKIEDYKEIEEKIKKNNNKEYILEETIYFDNGIYTLCINNNLLDKNYLICMTDVTDDIELEHELKNISTEYESIIENIPCAVMLIKSSEVIDDIHIYSINKAFEEVFGYDSEKMKGMKVKDYYDKFKIDFLDNIDYTILNLDMNEKLNNIKNNANKYNLITATMPNGKNEEKNLEITVDDFEDEGKVYKLLILKDVTEEVSTYKYINSQNNMYKKVLNTIPDGLVIEYGDTKEILYVNKKFMNIFSIDDTKLNMTDLIYKYRDRIETKFSYNLQNGNKEKSVHILNKNNDIKEVKVSSKTWYMNDERFKVKIIEDLSQQREAERMKEILIGQREYDKMKMEFYANMSHELKTPLNNIYSSLQLIESLYNKGKIIDKNKEVYNHIKTTKQNMFRLIRLIDNIINISQVKSEIYKIKYINFDIIYLIEEIVDSILPYARSRKLSLIFDTNEEEILVGLDPETIERIVLNLLSNSIKFTKEDGEIFVGVYKIEENIKIIIKDNGIGIDEEKLSDIFDRFKQIENGSISNEFGSGIGLYLSKSLIEFQGGNIDIKSKLNKGTEITIEFPIKIVKQEDEIAVEYNQNIEKFKIEFFDIYRS